MAGPWEQYGGAPAGPWNNYAKKKTLAQSNPGEYDPASPEYQAKYGATSGQSFGDNMVAGVGKSFVDTARGITQLGAKALDAVAPRAPTLSGLVTGADNSRAAGVQAGIDESQALDAPLMQTGGGVTGNLMGQAAQFAVPGNYAIRGASFLPRAASAAAFGAGVANTQPVATGQSRLANTAMGAAGGALGEGLAAGIGAASRASSKVTPEILALAQRAKALGIPLRAEQVAGSRPLAGVSAALDAVPFSGRDASRNTQRLAFNRAVSNTFGENSTNVATAVEKAQARLGSAYDSVLSQNGVKADNALLNDLNSAMQTARKELSDAQFGVINRQVDDILSKVGSNNEIDGQAAYNIKKVLDRLGKSSDTSLAYHAREVRDSMMQALDRSLPPDVAKAFAKTREEYSNLIAVRKLVKAGAEGDVSPARLATAQTRGKLKEVADIGAQFLKEPFGNSGTMNRMTGLTLLGGAGIASLPIAAKMAAVGATVGRGANALLQSPGLVNYQLTGSNALRQIAPITNQLLPLSGALAGGAVTR